MVTRGQARKQRVQDEQDRTLDAQSGAQPVQVNTLPPPNMTSAEDDGCSEEVADDVVLDEVAEQGVGGMCQIADGEGGEHVEEPVQEGRVDDLNEELGDNVAVGPLAALEEGADIPLPDMEGGEADREKLISEQTRDESHRDIRQWAEKGEKGFSLDNGLLVHDLATPAEQIHKRIVVPSSRRTELLKLAHSSMLSGHFFHTKTTELLNRRFTWPRMSVDVKNLCRQCVPCQKASNANVGKAPLKPLPVLDVLLCLTCITPD